MRASHYAGVLSSSFIFLCTTIAGVFASKCMLVIAVHLKNASTRKNMKVDYPIAMLSVFGLHARGCTCTRILAEILASCKLPLLERS